MWPKVLQLTCLCYLISLPQPSHTQGTCVIDGISSNDWLLGFVILIKDTDVGITFSGDTNVEHVPPSTKPIDFPLNNGPYVDFYLEDGKFIATLLDNFKDFEEYETSTSMVNIIQLACWSLPLNVEHRITDTNNHYPVFLDGDMEISIITPMNAGIRIPYEIRVRDVDLTTSAIDFDIVGGSPSFKIVYERRNGKIFYGALHTTSVITGLIEPLVLTISATDVDGTGDEPLTQYATITIISDPEFSIPPTPVFSQLFYSGTYNTENGLQVTGTIQLVQGYSEDVKFSLSGAYEDLFDLNVEGQIITLQLRDGMPATILETYTNLIVVVLATNTLGSVGSAPVFIELPLPRAVRFERDNYVGAIYGTTLSLEPIEVIEGFNENLVFTLTGDLEEYFTFFVVANLVVVMNNHNPLPSDFVRNFDFLNLILEVTGPNTVRTVLGITVAVDGDDYITPLFTQAYYTGSYNTHDGLNMDQPVVLSQGFDNTVSIGLSEGASEFFRVTNTGNNINLVHNDIPPSVIEDNTNLLFYIIADKPRTVGATATVYISLPQARFLQFTQNNYVGSFDGVELQLEPISLTESDYENLAFELSGTHSEYFTKNVLGNSVTIEAQDDFPEIIIEENDFINLEIRATAFNSVPTTAVITLTVIKDDSVTPVFSSPIYTGSYDLVNGLIMDSDIYLIQGFDDTVVFRKDEGDFNLLEMTTNLNSITLEVIDTIPINIIESNSNLLFTISAIKEGTVGATAAVNIALPEASILQFEYPSYRGRIWLGHESLDVISPPITLKNDLRDGITFSIQEEYKNYFEITYEDHVVTIKATEELINSDINDLVNIVLTATGRNSIPATTVLSLEVITKDTNTPVFSKAIYEGSYDPETEILTYEDIILAQGFDETVVFSLSGDSADYFRIAPNDHPVAIDTLNPLSAEFVRANRHILLSVVATKEWTVGASATLQINFPRFDDGQVRLLFDKALYSGQIQGENVILEPIPLPTGYHAGVTLSLDGVYKGNFGIQQTDEAIQIIVETPLPEDALMSNTFINLILNAEGPSDDYISSFTTIVLEIDSRELIVPIFTQPYYLATYTPPNLIVINNGPISLLDETYDDDLVFEFIGEYAEYFSTQTFGNFVVVSSVIPLPADVITSNAFINLQMSVSGPNHQTVTVIITTTIATDNLIPPEFNEMFYTGTLLLASNTVSINGLIFLLPGFDPSVQFVIEGDFLEYFTITTTAPSVIIARSNVPIPEQILIDNTFFTLILTARTNTLSSSVIVTLAIDNGEIVIAFNAEYFTGSYNPTTGITLDNEISITSGFDATVQYSLTGDYSQYFTVNPPTNPVTISAPDGVPSNVLAENTFITLVLTATGPTHIPAFRTITLEMISDTLITPEFSDIYYTGTLLAPSTITLNSPIEITQGFDESLELLISGEFEQYFSATPVTNPATITVTTPLPSDVLTENTFITLVLTATGPNHVPVTTTVTLEIADLIMPSFNLAYYTGMLTLPNNINLNNPIIVSEGFDDNLQFDVSGEYGDYFTAANTGTNSVNIVVSNDLPSGLVNDHTFITLVLTASSPYHYSATAIVTLEIADLITPQFDQIFYTGSLTVPNVIVLHAPITVSEGFDESLQFEINGEFGAYFAPTASDGIVSISLTDPLPDNILSENTYITLILRAFGINHETVTVTVSLEIIIATPVFDRIFYNGILTLPDQIALENPIIVIDGFDDSLIFTVSGEYGDNFSATSSSDGTISLAVTSSLPIDTITENAFISLIITASGPNHAASTTTVNLEIADLITPVFNQLFYTGTLTIPNTIVLHSPITLSEGFDGNLQVSIGDEFMEFFSASLNGDGIISISVIQTLPNEILDDNTYITLTLIASGPNHVTTRTTLSLEIIGLTTPVFSQIYYTGVLTLPEEISLNNPIVITEGFDDTLIFTVGGEYGSYFIASATDGNVNVVVDSQLPIETITLNAFITLTITASGPNHQSVTTTLSLEIAELIVPVFDRLYYTGSLTPPTTIALDYPITISSGFDNTLQFDVTGDYGHHFLTTTTGNTISISVDEPLPIDVLNDNTFITLVVTAFGPNHATVTTIVTIEIVNLITPIFDQIFYVGTLRLPEEIVMDTPIQVMEGFDNTIQFIVGGEFGAYFSATPSPGGTVTLAVSNELPSDTINENTFITLVLTASGPNHVTITTTVTLEIAELITPIFDQVFYTGTLTLPSTIVLNSPITITEGFDSSLEVTVGEEFDNYFTATLNAVDGTINIATISALPNDILDENTYITLILIASGPNHVTTRTTLSLEIIGLTTPVFNQIYYTGLLTLPNTIALNNPIIIAEGFDETLDFEVGGEYGSYFTATATGGTVNIAVNSDLPAETINMNAFITLTITAFGPNHQTVITTLSLEIAELIVPVFDQLFYTGSLTPPTAIALDYPIIIASGYDDTLQVSIDDGFEDYFSATIIDSTVSISVTQPLPIDILNDNTFITLVIRVFGINHATVTTTVTIEILNLITPVFDQIFYIGTLRLPQEITMNTPIQVVEGFDDSIQFIPSGEFGEYFSATSSPDGIITLTVSNDLPSDSVNENTFITLVLTATGPNHVIVTTTITLEIAELITPIFNQVFYTGTLTLPSSIVFDNSIIISEGFDDTLQIAVGEEFINHFSATLNAADGTVSVALIEALPNEILDENTYITLILIASGPNHLTTRTTLSLELIGLTTPVFNQIYYTGLLTLPDSILLNSPMIISEGYDETLYFTVGGEYGTHFTASATEGTVNIIVSSQLPSETINTNVFITLTITASGPNHQTVTTTLSLEIADLITPVFDQLFYTGSLTPPTTIVLDNPIVIQSGFDETLQVSVNGDFESYFDPAIVDNTVGISVSQPLPIDILNDNTFITLVITAFGTNHVTVTTTVTIEIVNLITPVFDQIFYVGTLRLPEEIVMNTPIQIVEGFDETIQFVLGGEFGEYFSATSSPNGIVTLTVNDDLPSDTINENTFITLVLTASGPNHIIVTTTITLEIAELITPIFDQVFYTGTLTLPSSIVLSSPITISEGFDETLQIAVGEEFENFFSATPNAEDGTINIALIAALPNEVLDENTYITLILIASGPNHVTTRTTLSLELIGLTTPVFNQVYYTGLLTLPASIILNDPIIISEGFDETLSFTVGGEYGSYFAAAATDGTVSVVVSSQLPSDTINANAFITLTITASGPNHQTVTTTLSLEIAELIVPVFNQLFYTGSLTPPTEILLDNPIIISSGLDDTLQTSINGDFEDYFTTNIIENRVDISVTQPLPIDVLNENTFITLVITAFGTNHATVTTTVTIEIVNLITPVFDQIFYVGTLRLPEEIVLDTPILVTEGFDETIQFIPSGEFGNYFSASASSDGIVTLIVDNDLPSDAINENTFITIVLTASGPNHVTVTTTITLEIAELITPIFDRIFYTGSLTMPDIIVLSNPITISEGFDNSLEFAVGEDYVEYFSATANENGIINIAVINALPSEIFDSNAYITLVLIASGPNHVTTRTTLSLELIGLTTPVFDQIFYTGVLNLPNVITLDSPINIIEGFDTSLQFTVSGEYGEYFSASASDTGLITVTVSGELPSDTINANVFITLVITASGPNHITTTNTLTLEVADLITPVFDQIFYVGTLTMPNVIELSYPIIVSEGFDETLQFSISGEFSDYFTSEPVANGATITVTNPLPSEVITDNRFITLILTAFGPNHVPVTTTVTLEILDLILPVFNQVYYTGVLSRHGIDLHNPIIVSEGYDDTIVFEVGGEFGEYFDATSDSGDITIVIVNDIPSETINENVYITLVLSASGPNHITVLTTVTLELAELIVPTFSELFYTGVHSPHGITLNSPIIVTSEIDETVQFEIIGEFAEYFTASVDGTQVNIEISTPLPSEIIYTNAFITLVLEASGPHHVSANVIITLEIVTEVAIVTQFEELFYTGVYNYPAGVELDSDIILSQGFDDSVTFTLSGEHASYFTASPPSNPVTIAATEVLPNEIVVENAFISLILTAIGPTHIPTTTIVTLEIVLLDEVPPAFDQVFYEGTYTSPGQLELENPVALNQGFDENVVFAISGDQSEYFSITANANPAVISATEPIPQQVIDDYTNLIFTVTATKPGTASASATIRVNLPPVLVNILRFERDSYVGYIEEGILNLEPIILSEGYNGEITYNLLGEFSSHFVLSVESNTVRISLQVPLPEEIIQQATFINVVLEAFTTGYSVGTTTAVTISVNPIQTLVPVFSQTSYSGSYSSVTGLIFDEEITLTQGFDDTVTFELSGDQSSPFTLTSNGNLAQISVETIPAEVIAANNHLLFSVNAFKEGTPGASSAVLIQLLDDVDEPATEPTILEFSQNSYSFTVTSNQLGIIGSVTARANTAETISYSLEIDNEHLRQRLQIGSTNGQIILTNYVNTGLYHVTVTARTINTGVYATVPLSLRVDSVFICNNNNFLLDPLIVIEQVEEEAFTDIVILNEELVGTCAYVITDSWPRDQPWFTIVNNNLASTAVNREDPSIAFMKLSQIQIELSLDCAATQNALSLPGNSTKRSRRSTSINMQDDTDEGDRTWLLSNEIKYTIERRVVNIVILDINDNSPIFEGSENQPVVVGYPDANTLGIISPPYLIQVHATDADIGINAHIRYSLTDNRLFIHPDTGVIYLMPDAMDTLSDGVVFDVFATDQYGLGNVGILNMQIRFLGVQHIVVLTIDNAYLESQEEITEELVNALNYRVKILSASVLPNLNPEEEEEETDVEPENPEPEEEETSEETPVDPEEESEEEPEEVQLIRVKKNRLAKVRTRNNEDAPLLTLYVYALDDQSALVDANTLVEAIRNGALDNISWNSVSQTLSEFTHVSFWSGLVITIFVLGGVLLLIFLTFILVLWYRIRQNKYKKFDEDGSVDSDKTRTRTGNSIIIPQTPTNQPRSTELYRLSKQAELQPTDYTKPRTVATVGPTVVVTDETGTKSKSGFNEVFNDKYIKDQSSSYVKFNEDGSVMESTFL